MRILISGDYCPVGRTKFYLETENYQELLKGFKKIIDTVDFSVVNFECPITQSNQQIKKTGPCLKSNDLNSLKALKFAGFDLLTLANNHIQDYGSKGVMDTLYFAKEEGFDTVGAGKNRTEAAEPFIRTINEIKVGFINIAENEFCAATDEQPGAYTLDFIDNLRAIRDLKKTVDKVILIYHGGREHYQLPTPEQRRRLRFFIENGVDAIVAHHTHCVSGYEYFAGKPIVYSLGNFIFDYKAKYQKGTWTEGMSVILSLMDIHSNFKVQLIPHLQGRAENPTFTILEGEERSRFLLNVERLSDAITNDEVFFREWEKYIATQESFYLPSLYIPNFVIRAFFIKKVLPVRLLKSRHNILALNLLRCEAHSEILKQILNK